MATPAKASAPQPSGHHVAASRTSVGAPSQPTRSMAQSQHSGLYTAVPPFDDGLDNAAPPRAAAAHSHGHGRPGSPGYESDASSRSIETDASRRGSLDGGASAGASIDPDHTHAAGGDDSQALVPSSGVANSGGSDTAHAQRRPGTDSASSVDGGMFNVDALPAPDEGAPAGVSDARSAGSGGKAPTTPGTARTPRRRKPRRSASGRAARKVSVRWGALPGCARPVRWGMASHGT